MSEGPYPPPAYSPEVVNLPLLWPFSIRGDPSYGGFQQCDDEGAIERWHNTRGLAYDSEGEAIGDFC